MFVIVAVALLSVARPPAREPKPPPPESFVRVSRDERIVTVDIPMVLESNVNKAITRARIVVIASPDHTRQYGFLLIVEGEALGRLLPRLRIPLVAFGLDRNLEEANGSCGASYENGNIVYDCPYWRLWAFTLCKSHIDFGDRSPEQCRSYESDRSVMHIATQIGIFTVQVRRAGPLLEAFDKVAHKYVSWWRR